MKMYKGFDKDLKCRGYQYQIGRTEKEERAELCDSGFHACEFPMDVFNHYPPADSRFCEVDLNGVTPEIGSDSKRCGTEIKVLAEIGVPGIVKAYAYAMTPYILVDRPDLSANQAINLSCKMMSGHKFDLFYLQLSFIGWAILCLFTLGIGFLWRLPYYATAQAAFYQDVKSEYEMSGIGAGIAA